MDDLKINLLRKMLTFSMRAYDFYVYHVVGNEYMNSLINRIEPGCHY